MRANTDFCVSKVIKNSECTSFTAVFINITDKKTNV